MVAGWTDWLCVLAVSTGVATPLVPASGTVERLWILTDNAANSSAVLGLDVGATPEVFLVVRSKAPTTFRALALTEGDTLAVIAAPGQADNQLRYLDGITGEALSTHPLPGKLFRDIDVFPDGTLGITHLMPWTGFLHRFDASGTLLGSWSTPWEVRDFAVLEGGRVWAASTEEPWMLSYQFDYHGNFQTLIGTGGKQLAAAPDGTLWFAGQGYDDLVHATQLGLVLGTIDVPSLPEASAVAVDSAGTVWVSGHGADRLERFAPDGTHLQTVLLPGSIGVRRIAVR